MEHKCSLPGLKSPLWKPILNQPNPIHTLKPYIFKIPFNIIVSSAPNYSKWSIYFGYSDLKFHVQLYTCLRLTKCATYCGSPISPCLIWSIFLSLTLHPQFGPWPTSMKLSVSHQLSRSTCTQTQKNAHTQILHIHAQSGIRTNEPGFRASEDSACLRPLGYRDRQYDQLDHRNSIWRRV
jgi:hypothetical protein